MLKLTSYPLKTIALLFVAFSLLLGSAPGLAQPPAALPVTIRVVDPAELAELPLANAAQTPPSYPESVMGPWHVAGENAQNGHIYGFTSHGLTLYELSSQGELLRTYDLAQTGLINPQQIFFAPSSDRTDAPDQVHLYVVDQAAVAGSAPTSASLTPCLPAQLHLPTILQSASAAAVAVAALSPGAVRVLEINLTPVTRPAPLATIVTLPLVQTIHTSQLSPPSPDAAGITYHAARGQLIFSDSEVDEMPNLYRGSNVFRITLTGVLQGTMTTLAFSKEPTGLAVNPQNGHLFYTDDDADQIFEVNPGADGELGTADDQVTAFNTRLFESFDPEDITYDVTSGSLYIVDGVNAEVYALTPGANGSFDGVASVGDDQVRQFDTLALGIVDPEGIGKDENSGNLLLTGNAPAKFFEVSPTGTLVRIFDIAAAKGKTLAGVTVAPGSIDTASQSYYVVDRGVDNQNFPDENDGRIYEFAQQAGTDVTPVVNTPEPTTPGATATPTVTPSATVEPTRPLPVTPTATPTPTISPTAPCTVAASGPDPAAK